MAELKDIMVKDVVTIDSRESVLKAAEKMTDLDISGLVVEVDGEAAGMITEAGIISKVVCRKNDPATTEIRSVMSTPLVTIHPLASLEDAARVFNETGFKRLVVSSGDSLEGIISIDDLIAEETRFIQLLERYIQILKARK